MKTPKKKKHSFLYSLRGVSIVFIMTIILAVGLYVRYIYNPSGLLRDCPNLWISGEGMPDPRYSGQGGINQMNFSDGRIIQEANKEVDIKWVKNNCPVKKPEQAPV